MMPFVDLSSPGATITYSVGYPTLEQIRQVVREEIHKALHPEEARPSATIDCEMDGKRWRGKVYLVEDEEG